MRIFFQTQFVNTDFMKLIKVWQYSNNLQKVDVLLFEYGCNM